MPGPIEIDTIVAGRYTLERRIGESGIGSLWLARDEQTVESCVLRLAERKGHNIDISELAVRYRAEYELVEKIRCENVVDIMDYGDWRGMPYLVSEYVDCEDLAARLRGTGALSPEIAYRILAHTARALARAHAVGIVHGDVTPENILVTTREGELVAKLYNFGLTQRTAENQVGTVTRIGSFVRLPHYASPEQTASAPLDYRSDLWSLGVVGYECLTGRKPFESDVYGELVAKILCAPHPQVDVDGCREPQALQMWFERSCAREATKRFQSAKDMADVLASALGVSPVFMPEASPRQSNAVGPFAVRSSVPPLSSSPGSVRRQPFQAIPRRMTPLGIGAVNPNLISATPPPAWSTQEVSSELRALEAQRFSLEKNQVEIPKAPRVPSLSAESVVTRGIGSPLTATSEFGSEAPTLARRSPTSGSEYADSEAPTVTRSNAALPQPTKSSVVSAAIDRESEPSSIIRTNAEERAGTTAIVLAHAPSKGFTGAQPTWSRRVLLMALGAIAASAIIFVARLLVHNDGERGPTVVSAPRRGSQTSSDVVVRSTSSGSPIVPAEVSPSLAVNSGATGEDSQLATKEKPAAAATRSGLLNQPSKISERRPAKTEEPSAVVQQNTGTTLPTPEPMESNSVPKGTTVFEPGGLQSGQPKPQPSTSPGRDYGI